MTMNFPAPATSGQIYSPPGGPVYRFDDPVWTAVTGVPPTDDMSGMLVSSTPSAAIPTETHTLADWMQYVAPLSLNTNGEGRWGLDNSGGLFIKQNVTGPAVINNYGSAIRTDGDFTYTGGAAGTVYGTARIYTKVSAGVADYIWGLNGILDNYATAGENVAGSFTGRRRAAGPTWGGLINVEDYSNAADGSVAATGATIGLEVGHYSSGPAAGGRVILHLAYGQQTGGIVNSTVPQCTRGLHISQALGVGTLGTAIQLDGPGGVGINMEGSTYSTGSSIRMAPNSYLAWNTDVRKIGVVTGTLVYAVSGTAVIAINDAGNLITNGMITAANAVPSAAGGAATPGIRFGAATHAICYGSGPPTISAAKGSLYLRSDGTGTNDRMYVNTNGSTTWTALVTVA